VRKHEGCDDKKQTSKEKKREHARKRNAKRGKREKAAAAASIEKVIDMVDESVSVASQKLIIAKRNKRDASKHKSNPEEQKRRQPQYTSIHCARKMARAANDAVDEFNRLLSGTADVGYGYCKECTFQSGGEADVAKCQ
jgi:hypothetical protein